MKGDWHKHWENDPPWSEHEHDAPRATHDLSSATPVPPTDSNGRAEEGILTASMMAVLADALARSGKATIDGNVSDITPGGLYASISDVNGLVMLDGTVNVSAWVHLAMARIRQG